MIGLLSQNSFEVNYACHVPLSVTRLVRAL